MSRFYIAIFAVALTLFIYMLIQDSSPKEVEISSTTSSSKTSSMSSQQKRVEISYTSTKEISSQQSQSSSSEQNKAESTNSAQLTESTEQNSTNIIARAEVWGSEGAELLYICEEGNTTLGMDKDRRYVRLSGTIDEKRFNLYMFVNEQILQNCNLLYSQNDINTSLDFLPLETLKEGIINRVKLDSNNLENFILQNYEEKIERIPVDSPLPR